MLGNLLAIEAQVKCGEWTASLEFLDKFTPAGNSNSALALRIEQPTEPFCIIHDKIFIRNGDD